MNKKTLIILTVIVIIILIIGESIIYLNNNKSEKKEKSNCISNSTSVENENILKVSTNNYNFNRIPENVTIEVIESSASPNGVTILITDKNEHYYNWGEQFSVQKKVNEEWYDIKYISDTVSFTLIGYMPNKNNQLTQKIDWTKYYGELPTGTYRIVKQVYDNKYINLYSNEFKI